MRPANWLLVLVTAAPVCHAQSPVEQPLPAFHTASSLFPRCEFKMRWRESSDLSLSDALQEQLGLQLEPRKALTEVLVIDHVDKAPKTN